LKAQVNERSDAFYNKFKELISIQYCTCIYYIVGGGGGRGGLLFFRIHVKGVIEFFCDAGGGARTQRLESEPKGGADNFV
jgi:hypothetical protein